MRIGRTQSTFRDTVLHKRGTLRVVTTTMFPCNFVIRDSEESSIVKKGRSIWDASAAEKLSRCRTQRVLPGILAALNSATERITQRTARSNVFFFANCYFVFYSVLFCSISSVLPLSLPAAPCAASASSPPCTRGLSARVHYRRRYPVSPESRAPRKSAE